MSTSKVSGRAYGVTGGASGLGEAVVTRLTRDGASCLVMDRDETRGAALAAANPRVLFVPTDVTSHESVAAAFAAALERFGRMDGVINCAGLGPTELTLSRDGKPHRPKLWDFVVKVNLYGVFNCASLGAQAMQRSGCQDGVIINVASIAGIEGQKGQVAYAASKGGVIGMTLPMARDLARHNIRVNTIAPGIMDTPLMAKAPDKVREGLLRGIVHPKRLGAAEEFAALCMAIIECGYLNGETIRFDGGLRFANM